MYGIYDYTFWHIHININRYYICIYTVRVLCKSFNSDCDTQNGVKVSDKVLLREEINHGRRKEGGRGDGRGNALYVSFKAALVYSHNELLLSELFTASLA